MDKTKIAIVGTGGVGGFLGGELAAFYAADPAVEVYFISRGEALRSIQADGLRVDTQSRSYVARPALATDDAAAIGPVDYLLYCTKAYDVEAGISQAMPCIGPQTVVLPFLNGVDSGERIARMLPRTEVWMGCVYVVAFIVEPGHIAEQTNGYRYYFGSPDGTPARLAALDGLFVRAGINARMREDIVRCVWDKFAFISPVATVTSYTDLTYGDILSTPELRGQLLALLDEFKAVAAARGKELSPDVVEAVVAQMERIPADTTTSMQRDFRAGRPTELESLTGYLVREGHRLGVPVPTYERMYAGLEARAQAAAGSRR
ncbi:MAG: 2-dehydropantoate 2-reductase [Rikenellaceae bacterium]|nr:2-dehydropantoate 2-reductase [Rikenellaceae bacterium]